MLFIPKNHLSRGNMRIVFEQGRTGATVSHSAGGRRMAPFTVARRCDGHPFVVFVGVDALLANSFVDGFDMHEDMSAGEYASENRSRPLTRHFAKRQAATV